MGQDISFEKVDSGNSTDHIYSLNRSLTGMEIASYDDVNFEVDKNNGADVLAKHILGLGVNSVSIYSNVITINCDSDKFKTIESKVEEVFSNLFRFYGDQALWSLPNS
jgi:hypothetical protein